MMAETPVQYHVQCSAVKLSFISDALPLQLRSVLASSSTVGVLGFAAVAVLPCLVQQSDGGST